MKAKDIMPPLVIVGAIGIIAYALLAHPAGASTSLPGTFNPKLGAVTPSMPRNSPTTTYNTGGLPAMYGTTAYTPGASLQMPKSGQGATTSTFNIPAFAMPGMTVNNISGSACGGCGNF